jgi:hypothetical protein
VSCVSNTRYQIHRHLPHASQKTVSPGSLRSPTRYKKEREERGENSQRYCSMGDIQTSDANLTDDINDHCISGLAWRMAIKTKDNNLMR